MINNFLHKNDNFALCTECENVISPYYKNNFTG